MSWFSEKVGKPLGQKLKRDFVSPFTRENLGGGLLHQISGSKEEKNNIQRRLGGAAAGAAGGFVKGGLYGAVLGGVSGYQSNKPLTGQRSLEELGKGVLIGAGTKGIQNLGAGKTLFGGMSGLKVAGANGGNLLGTGANTTWSNGTIAGTNGATWGNGTALGGAYGWKDYAQMALKAQNQGGQGGGQEYPEEPIMPIYPAYTSQYLGQYSPFNPVKYRTYGGGGR